jgi:hypothetical protein
MSSTLTSLNWEFTVFEINSVRLVINLTFAVYIPIIGLPAGFSVILPLTASFSEVYTVTASNALGSSSNRFSFGANQ